MLSNKREIIVISLICLVDVMKQDKSKQIPIFIGPKVVLSEKYAIDKYGNDTYLKVGAVCRKDIIVLPWPQIQQPLYYYHMWCELCVPMTRSNGESQWKMRVMMKLTP